MSAKPQAAIATPGSRISYEEFLQLGEERYELNEGVLVLNPSPTGWHNLILDRIAHRLRQFAGSARLGVVLTETDFKLAPLLVLRPDVAFVSANQAIDIQRSPINGSPTLAVEVISPGNSAIEVKQKIDQYIDAGCKAVWTVFPEIQQIAVARRGKAYWFISHEKLVDVEILGEQFTLSLQEIFDPDAMKP